MKKTLVAFLGENQDEDHADKQSRLLGIGSYPGISNNANGKSSQPRSRTMVVMANMLNCWHPAAHER